MKQRYMVNFLVLQFFLLFLHSATVQTTYLYRSAAPKPGGVAPSFHYIDALSVTDFRNPGESTLTKTYVINAPGTYTFVQDIGSQSTSSVTGIGSQTALFINASNVIVDLGGRTLWQNGSAANISGIEVNRNLHNITIKNGHIAEFKGYGILVNYGCDDIRIQNITVSNCITAGIGLLGTTTAEQEIRNVVIDNCVVSNITGKATVDAVGLLIHAAANVYVSDSVFGRCKSAADDAYGVRVQGGCKNINFQNCDASGNQGDSAAGFAFLGTDIAEGCSLINCTANNNHGNESSALGYSYGFAFTSAISDNNAGAISARGFYLESCTAMSNKGAASSHGFYFGNAEYFHIMECKALGNTVLSGSTATHATDGAHGFSCYKGAGHIFENCLAVGNISNQDTNGIITAGFFAQETNNVIFKECQANNNQVTGHTVSEGAGFYLDGATNSCINTLIRNCKASNHRGLATGYGFYDGSLTSTTFIADCTAFGNTVNYLINPAVGAVHTDAPQKVGTLANVQQLPLLNLDITSN